MSLFPDASGDVLVRLHVSPDEVARWHAKGWVPFDPKTEEELHPAQISHLCFVRSVVRSGLSDAFIARLMQAIPHDTLVDHRSIALSFIYGWVCPSPPVDPTEPKVLFGAIEQLVEEEEWYILTLLRDRLDEVLKVEPESE